MQKIKLPRIKIRLRVLLWIIFLAIVLLEALVLFRSLRVDSKVVQNQVESSPIPLLIDLPLYEEAINWLSGQKSYQAESYDLRNPFVEYK